MVYGENICIIISVLHFCRGFFKPPTNVKDTHVTWLLDHGPCNARDRHFISKGHTYYNVYLEFSLSCFNAFSNKMSKHVFAYRQAMRNGSLFIQRNKKKVIASLYLKILIYKFKPSHNCNFSVFPQNSLVYILQFSSDFIYSGAKKYLVSHKLCKFSHLKR